MKVEELSEANLPALQAFFRGLPDGDVTFIKEDLSPATLQSWVQAERRGRRWVGLDDDGSLAGFVAILPLTGWSSHVGELRLVVDPGHRGRGVGRDLASHALDEAVRMGLAKVVVEVVAVQQGTVAMFTNLGFTAEAVLDDHIRDRDGELRDLMLLAHKVDDSWSAMSTVGVEEALA